jgi:hypothetical protein
MSSLHPGLSSEGVFTALYKDPVDLNPMSRYPLLTGDGPKEGERRHDEDRAFRWLAMGTEIPIMVFLGALIGYNLGKKLGPPYEFVGLTLGAFLGFAFSLIPLFKGAGASGRRGRTS